MLALACTMSAGVAATCGGSGQPGVQRTKAETVANAAATTSAVAANALTGW